MSLSGRGATRAIHETSEGKFPLQQQQLPTKGSVAEFVGQNGTGASRDGILVRGAIWRRTVLARPIMSFSLWTMDCRGIRPRWNERLPLAKRRFYAVWAENTGILGTRGPVATHKFCHYGGQKTNQPKNVNTNPNAKSLAGSAWIRTAATAAESNRQATGSLASLMPPSSESGMASQPEAGVPPPLLWDSSGNCEPC